MPYFFFLDEAISTLRITKTRATERKNLIVTAMASSRRPGVYLFWSSFTSVPSRVSRSFKDYNHSISAETLQKMFRHSLRKKSQPFSTFTFHNKNLQINLTKTFTKSVISLCHMLTSAWPIGLRCLTSCVQSHSPMDSNYNLEEQYQVCQVRRRIYFTHYRVLIEALK